MADDDAHTLRPSVLVSGAGIAGAIVAYWLARHHYDVTVVERADALKKTGGHALDLGGPAVEVFERMDLLRKVSEARVRRPKLTFVRPGKRPITMPRLSDSISDRHIEIQRDDLTEILYQATRTGVEYLFDDSIARLATDHDGVDVEFENAPARRFDVVIGADGLHSRVRRLVFGPESQFLRYLGGYLCVFSFPNHVGLEAEVVGYPTIDRVAFVYPVGDGEQARAILLFRQRQELEYHRHDLRRQRQLVREAFSGAGWELPHLLDHADEADDFYFDSISQVRMPTWTHDRIALVGDAAFSPGPAVGGGTSLAVLSAYVLAQELAHGGAEYAAGLRSYEDNIRSAAAAGHKVGPSAMKQLIPATDLGVRLMPRTLQLAGRLPRRFLLWLFSLQNDGATLDDFTSSSSG